VTMDDFKPRNTFDEPGSTGDILPHEIPDQDFFKYFTGTWKRNLEWVEFGRSFSHFTNTNSFIKMEECVVPGAPKNIKYGNWYFGPALDQLQFGYRMKFDNTKENNDYGETSLMWDYQGSRCDGRFFPNTGVVVLNFFLETSVVTSTYRILDANSMAVCTCEVIRGKAPVIQYGNLYRLDPRLYQKPN